MGRGGRQFTRLVLLGRVIQITGAREGVFCFEKLGYRYEGQWEGDLPNGKGKESWVRPGYLATY